MGGVSIIQVICIAAIPLIFAITLHEAAHGFIASKLGDQTASIMGRVSLNPLKHIDPVGTIILPLLMLTFGGFIFGWAKPVPVAWQNLKNPKRDMALVALAGPGANLLMALIWGAIAKLSYMVSVQTDASSFLQSASQFLHLTSRFGIMINCVLLVINLIPIPPLDGSRVISSFLSPINARKYDRLEPYGIWIFLGIMLVLYATGNLMIIWGPILTLARFISQIFGLPVL